MPESFTSFFSGENVSTLLRSLAIIAAAIVGALVVHQIGFGVARRIVERLGAVAGRSLVKRSSRPMAFILPVIALQLVLPLVPLPPGLARVVPHAISIALIVGVTWLLARLTHVPADIVAARFPITVADNLRARRLTTLVRIMRQVAAAVIIVIGAAVALMTFPQARELGASVLASAGIAGLAIGMAARPALSNVIAGIQIALTEPIALDDVVIVEGEYGNVEEITMTYVVVRVWDLRRLIIPLSHFIEKPFQNWTRTSAALLGSVMVHTDFTVPVAALRAELDRLLDGNQRWDGKVKNVQVTDAINGRVELRLLVSAAAAGVLWDLRCEVREGIVGFIQREYPGALQRTRVELGPVGPGLPGGENKQGPRPEPIAA